MSLDKNEAAVLLVALELKLTKYRHASQIFLAAISLPHKNFYGEYEYKGLHRMYHALFVVHNS